MRAKARIGVAFPGDPAHRATWSGTPSGVIRGLTECGAEVVPIRAEPDALVREAAHNLLALPYLRPQRDWRAAVKRARAASRASPGLAWVNTKAVPRRLRDAGHLDGIVQIGTGYLMPPGIPVATFEDMTVRQVATHPYLGWDALSKRAWASRIALQRRAYEGAVAVCLTSRWAAESVVHDYGIEESKVHVVGVGRNHSPVAAERDWSVPHFLFVGIDWERKNGPALLRAFARLREEIPAATLDVVGGHPPISQEGVTGHGDPAPRRARAARARRAAVRERDLLRDAVAGRGVRDRVRRGRRRRAAEHRLELRRLGLPDRRRRPDRRPARRRGRCSQAMRRLSDGETAKAMGAAAKRRSDLFTWPQVGRRLLDALEGKPAPPLAEA